MFVRKEIGKFQVKCQYHANGCPWSGVLRQLEKHIATCDYEQQECKYCYELFHKSKVQYKAMLCRVMVMQSYLNTPKHT